MEQVASCDPVAPVQSHFQRPLCHDICAGIFTWSVVGRHHVLSPFTLPPTYFIFTFTPWHILRMTKTRKKTKTKKGENFQEESVHVYKGIIRPDQTTPDQMGTMHTPMWVPNMYP